MNNIETLITIPENEKQSFSQFIKQERKFLIKSPKETTHQAIETNKEQLQYLLEKGQISETIILLRELSYRAFLKEESKFNGKILQKLSDQFPTPKIIIDQLSEYLFNLHIKSKEEFQKSLLETIGNYTGAISPYIYELCLSNTQSRRSRAGKTFEEVIYYLYEYFNYPFNSQSQVGKKTFTNLGLGKMVDSILPSIEAFNERRDKTIIGTMKTTLRERWQEVVEEVGRSNVPSIYLLTVDHDISHNKALQMSNHNIILVVSKTVKQSEPLKDKRSIIDFETYFLEEIPNIINYWRK